QPGADEPPMNLGLSFLRGMVASVNPCAFVLLPTYLVYFLGVEAEQGGPQRASVRRALGVSASVSAGFMSVFVVAGVLSNSVTKWLDRNAKYATAVIGVALILLGVAMLFGYRLPFATPNVSGAGRDRTARSMFVYGVAYALASIGCTIGLFAATAFAAPDSFAAGVISVIAYGASMALVVTALTVSLAVANHALLKVLRSVMRYANQLAAAFVLLSGAYLLYYFWVVDVNEESDTITDAVDSFQGDVVTRLNDNWQLAALVLGAIVLGAALYVGVRRRGDAPPVASPDREASRR
ncbi:MAG: cytochrome c biogenesis CcdA family protein, partial [Ilumatobacteraceae bacterium]